jgi:ABC-2 type transport system permease protein
VFGQVLGAALRRPVAPALLAAFLAAFAVLTLGVDDLFASPVATLREPLAAAATCLLFLAPAASARVFQDEERAGAWQIAAALPLRPIERVTGSWLAVVAILAAALALTAPWPVALAVLADPDPMPIATGYLGLLLAAAAYAAIGVAASAWVPSPSAAFLLTLAVGFVPWLLGRVLPLVPGAFARPLAVVSLGHHLDPFLRGVLDLRAVAAFAGVTVLALALAAEALARRPLR